MPLYEYLCADCGTKFEELRPSREMDASIACPACTSNKTVRALSIFACSNTIATGGADAGGGHCCEGCCHNH